ncbi:MAG: M1 family peptidase, partial [Myxococcales bacterium]|nr:M1 family peptidase [Myxococcales bacterium]
MSVWRRLLIGGLLVVGCGSTPPVTSNPVADEAGPDGHRRLDHAVVPLRYDLDLTVDPAEAAYAGQAQIAVRLEAARAVVELHGRDLDVDSVTAAVGAAERKGRAVQGPNGGLALVFAEPLPAGEVTLKLSFRARLPEVPNGLYRVKEGGLWYAFTQFEPMYARQAFPCFDQPEFKTPYRVTLRVPQGQLALANSPEQSRRDELGLTVFEFAETKPLPTYLVAFAVGEFDVVEAPADAIPNLPLRLVATKGKGRLAKYALERAPVIHKALSDYFGTPHPFAKLDLVAVPNFAAGAMENVGLITFRETLLLLDEASAPANHKMWSQSVIAHEMAHMWFGNEVTLAWWDDLWLNEAFATWTAAWVVASVDPELEMDLERVAGTAWVMDLDAQAHTRSIRQPIAHGGDVHNAFDGITYGKGAAVLRMLESWIGRETFRDGVRAYLAAHAYGTATTSDLLEALARQSGKPVAETAKWFLDQPGTPLVQIDVLCTEGGPATLGLSQRRALPAGSTAPQGEPWHVPMCVRYGIGEEVHRECFLLEGKQQTVALHAPGCPAWLSGNDDQRGYYQWR